MAYRGEDAGDALEAPTAEGLLRISLGPNRADLAVAHRSLHIVERIVTLVEHKKQKHERRGSIRITGNLVVARGFPREDLGIWIERPAERPSGLDPRQKRFVERRSERRPEQRTEERTEARTDRPSARSVEKPRGGGSQATSAPTPEPYASMQRIFGVQPVSLLEEEGLSALGRLDLLAQQLRSHLSELAGGIRRAFEIGSGHELDKVLLADHGDHYVFYARRLFRDRARFAMAVHRDGRIVLPEGKRLREIRVTSRFGITVRGDYVRFSDRHGTDLGRVSLPWLGPEDREEIARRIGMVVDREHGYRIRE